MSSPKLLLLDEPSMGLAPILVEEIFRFIQEINKRGTTILLVEQNAHLALEISHQACVLETGQIALAGSAAEVAADGRIQEIYLGAG
jgi:branched-chain amino acid transport system ATP-binding protein